MKKILALVMVLAMVLALAACGSAKPAEPSAPELPADDPTVKSEGVMTYAEYAAADLDSQVTVETYVQAKQSWWDNKATLYTQDADGGYFLYNAACSEEDYNKLVEGSKIKVTGYKSEWAGEVEIIDATFEIESGKYIAKALDVTKLLGTDDLIKHQNELASFTGMTVESISFKNGEPGKDPRLFSPTSMTSIPANVTSEVSSGMAHADAAAKATLKTSSDCCFICERTFVLQKYANQKT